MQRLKFSLACLMCLMWAAPALAQTALESDSGIATMQQFSGGVTLNGTYFDVRYMSGNGVGYQNGYTQIGGFMPIWFTEDMYLAPNARLLISDSNQAGTNTGLVFRRYQAEADRIVGANIYWDYDNSVERFNYQQVGFGFENLGQWFDFRANFYLPTSTDRNFIRAVSLSDTPFFFGNSIGFLGVGQYQKALRGGDFEFGVPLSKATPWLRGYAGMYYYDASQNTPLGFRGRVEAWVSDDLSLGVNVTEDAQFGTNVNAVVDWRFSGFKPTRYFPQWTTRERMMMPVQRNWRVATGYEDDTVNVQAINPLTGQPYFVVWVDNSNFGPGPGTGTYENPLHNLPNQAPGADLILVNRGVSLVNPYDGSIHLFNNQRLLGEGKAHTFDATASFAGLTVGGTYVLPGFTDSGNFPFMTSSTGDIITIASGNEVSAFNLINAVGDAVTNVSPFGSHDFNLNCLNMSGNAGGIFLSNATGTGVIRMVNALNNTAGGVYLDSGFAGLNLTMTDVTSNSLPVGTQGVGISINADNGDINADMTRITANGNGTGLLLTATNGNALDVALTDANFNLNLGDGVLMQGSFGRINVAASDVRANLNVGHGFSAVADNTYFTFHAQNVNANANGLDNVNFLLSNSTMDVELQNSSFRNSANGSGIVVTNAAGGGSLLIDTVSVAGNSLDGLLVATSLFADVDTVVRTSDFSDNGRDALSVFADTGSQQTFAASASLANNSGRDGFHFQVQNDAVLTADLTGVNLSNSGRSAVYGLVDNGDVDLVLNRSRGDNSGADGMFIQAVNDSNVVVSVARGDFSNSGQTVDPAAAIRILADDSNVSLQVANTPLNNTVIGGPQDDGLNLIANNFSNVLINLSNSDMSGNADNALDLTVDNNSQAVLNLLLSSGNDSGNDAILFQALNNSLLVVNASQSNFDRAGMNGINGLVNNTSTASFNFLTSTVANSGDDGMVIVADNGSAFLASFESGSFVNSGQNGNGAGKQDAINLFANNGSTIAISLLNTPSGNVPPNVSQQHSLFGVIQNGSSLFYTDQGGDMSNNTINAINLTFGGGSFGSINVFNTLAENSGEDGFIFVVDASTMLADVENSSFNNSGSGGVNGSAVNGLLVNGAYAQLDFLNTTSNGAFDHGLAIAAYSGSTFVGDFDASTFDMAGSLAGVPSTAGNAVLLIANASNIDLTMSNGSTGNLAGGNGLDITAVNGSNVTGTFTDGSFSDEGQFTNLGVGVNVFNDNSFVALDFTNTPTTNTAGNTTQAFGLLFNVQNGGDLFANYVNGDLSNHTINGITGSVTGAGSSAAVTLDQTNVDNNFLIGALYSVTAGAQLHFNIPNGGSISNNGSYGVFATVDGVGSLATFDFVDAVVDNNGLTFGGDGFNVSPTGGARVEASFTRGSISSNFNRGVSLTLADASSALFQFDSTTVDNNGDEGFFFDVAAAQIPIPANLVITAVNASFSNNGLNGSFDNVNGQISGGIVDALFSGVTADNSTHNGFNFDVSDAVGPTSVVVQLNDGTSASTNANGNGVRMVSTGPTTSANLLMIGDNQFNDNGTAAPTLPVPGTPGSGVYFEADNVLQAAFRFSGSASNNGNAANPLVDQDGVTVDIDTAQFAAVEFNGPGNVDNNAGDGIDIRLNAVTNLQDLNVFTQTGVELVEALSISGLTTNNNGGGGVVIVITGNPATTLPNDILIDGLTSTGNAGSGVELDLVNVAGEPGLFVTNSDLSNNGVDGFHLELTNSSLSRMYFDANTMSGNTDDGIDLGNNATIVNSNLVAVGEVAYFTNNTVDGNGGDGLTMVNPGVVANSLQMGFIGNSFSSNGGNGVDLQVSLPIVTLGVLFDANTISGNTGGRGVNLQLNNGADLAADFTNNTISTNSQDGVNILLTPGSVFTGNQFFGNTISGNGTSGLGMGVRLTAPDATTVAWNVGALGQNANTVSGNRDAGVGIDMAGTAFATIRVRNGTFSDTVDGADANFDGDGFAVRMVDQANLANFIVGEDVNATRNTFFTGNADDGISVFLTGTAQMNVPGFFNIGATENGRASADGSGLRIDREGTAVVNNVFIAGSSFDNNDDGVTLRAAAAPNVDEYFVFNNTFNNNTNRGMHLRVEADANMLVDVEGNTIQGNANEGVQFTESVNAATDIRDISGLFRNNLITLNGDEGLQITSVHGTQAAGLTITQNVITFNGQNAALITDRDGIDISNAGFATISLNMIDDNRGSGINVNSTSLNGVSILNNEIARNLNKGVELFSTATIGLSATVQGNTILGNTGDGVEVVTRGTGTSTNVLIGGALASQINTISDNGGRGIDILNAGFAPSTTATIQGNNILRNGQEGVYVVNSSDGNQASDVSASVALSRNGSVFSTPILQLNLISNQINDNGASSTFDTTGFVLRVGTSGGGYAFNNAAANGFATNQAIGAAFNTRTLNGGAGGVLADVRNNLFNGNFGNDVALQADNTTVDPTTTTGQWSDQNDGNAANDVFNVTSFQGDPLARLDIRFTGNTGLAASVSRVGSATYSNAEPIFKSRLNNLGTESAALQGPFTSATRLRNATRLPSRNAPFNPPLSGLGAGFLYPGVDNNVADNARSLFRATTDSTTAGFALGNTFGTATPIGALFGELSNVYDVILAP